MAKRLANLPSDFGEHFLPYKPSLRQRIQGRRYANESYIAFVKLFGGSNNQIHVKSGVFRSQRKTEKPHTINMAVKEEGITDAHCSCKSGAAGECSHVLAVVLKLTDWLTEGLSDVPSQPACTSEPRKWDKPRGTKIRPEPVATMVLARSAAETRKKRPLLPVYLDNRKIQVLDTDIEVLQSMSNTPLGYLATVPFATTSTSYGLLNVGSTLSHQLPLVQPVAEPTTGDTACASGWQFPATPDIQNLEIVKDYEGNFINVAVSTDEANEIELETRSQSNSERWMSERKKRLTASNFGRIMNRKTAVTKKCVDSIMNVKPFTSKQTDYGSANELVAINIYRRLTKNHVHDCGLMINPRFPCIGASPDGKVCSGGEGGILEVKCPFWCRDMTLDDAIDIQNKDFHLIKSNETFEMKKGHNYWWQVQGQLLVSGATWCDFVTYTRKDLCIIRVAADRDAMESLLSKMCDVFGKFIHTTSSCSK